MESYTELAPGVSAPTEAFYKEPTIRKHVDGPLLSWVGQLHWLTWCERFLVWCGYDTAESLAQKHWPLRLQYTDGTWP